MPLDESLFTDYCTFIERVDAHCRTIREQYPDELSCGPRCTECCEAGLSLFPIEALYIRSHMKNPALVNSAGDNDRCPFLLDGLCSVYEHRPLVCRTQGYPLLYGSHDDMNDMEISCCDLNFGETETIEEESLIDMDSLNLELAVLNLKFLAATNLLREMRDRRIDMSDIASL